jgi:trk system potassium uptake protein TrkH
MELSYKNERFEKVMTAAIIAACAATALSFALLLGFEITTISLATLYLIQVAALLIFLGDRLYRMFTARSSTKYIKSHWPAFVLIVILFIMLALAPWFGTSAHTVRHYTIGIYLLIQMVAKMSNAAADLTAKGRNPAKIIIVSFGILIIVGTIFLILPRSTVDERHTGFIDALFTATSATCLTGLTVQNTAEHFSYRGQLVILALIQLGALGIIIFGAVFALMIRQAWSARENAAIKEMLGMEVRSHLGRMMLFIFVSTAVIESLGALLMLNTWTPEVFDTNHSAMFVSVFHSVSAFCNAGFTLFADGFGSYGSCWGLYMVVCPLIILGGLGFSVLSDLFGVASDKIKRVWYRRFRPTAVFETSPKRMELQTRIVLIVSAILIVGGAVGLLLFENILPTEQGTNFGPLDSLFQSITARTAGFSTVDIGTMSGPSQLVLIVLMLIGGSPGSAAGGIKTVTLAILVMTAYTTIRKRSDVQIANRSIPLAAVGMAITVTLLFLLAMAAIALLLCITERHSGFTMGQLFFETASALSACGLSTGITASLTTGGKLLMIMAMLIGRLGPLMLLTALTLNMKPARYSYPEEPITAG